MLRKRVFFRDIFIGNIYFNVRGTELFSLFSMIRQVYLALGVFLSACAAMEIDSTPIEGIIIDEYAKIRKLHSFVYDYHWL